MFVETRGEKVVRRVATVPGRQRWKLIAAESILPALAMGRGGVGTAILGRPIKEGPTTVHAAATGTRGQKSQTVK